MGIEEIKKYFIICTSKRGNIVVVVVGQVQTCFYSLGVCSLVSNMVSGTTEWTGRRAR